MKFFHSIKFQVKTYIVSREGLNTNSLDCIRVGLDSLKISYLTGKLKLQTYLKA